MTTDVLSFLYDALHLLNFKLCGMLSMLYTTYGWLFIGVLGRTFFFLIASFRKTFFEKCVSLQLL